ncbi:sensor histidine kinase [Cohnella herbarum]|uniref:histidine kinase n=1 Tax=Cohnella herbarum TaxID=2728023 RepID=A0A7Z2VQ21_9BACL|nr:sensor histidine kinase [Cohnella herbarum]QJD87129.1 sensor histidine kinase [Cohnella herbarum]
MIYSLRTRLSATFIVVFIVPFITMVAVFTQVSNSVIGTSIEESTSQTMDQYAAFVNTLTTSVEDVANQVLSNEVTQQWIGMQLDKSLPQEKRIAADNEIRKFLSSIALNHSSISSITLFNENGTAVGIRDQVFNDPSFLNSDWYKTFEREEVRWVPAHIDLYQPNYLKKESMNSLIYNLVQLSSFRKIGVLKLNVRTSQIQTSLDKIKFGETGRVYLVDMDGNPVLQQQIENGMAGFRAEMPQIRTDKHSGGKLTIAHEGENHRVLYRKIKSANWMLVGEVKEYELFEKMKRVQQTMMVVGALLLLLTIAAAFWFSSGIARPLTRLASSMRLVERGDFSREEDESLARMPLPRNEVGYVVKVFRNMVTRLRFLIETEFQANMRRKDAEYKALLMQINPHFLYNTLEAIGSLSVQQRSEEVIDVTEWLGQMLRYSLRVDSDLVKLREEMQYIRYYVSIMKIRFGDRFSIDIQDSPELGDVPIVKFILQPLVENAIKFSQENPSGAHVELSTRRVNDTLEIRVSDNGTGMSTELIEELREEMSRDQITDVLSAHGRRIGLRNVLARCCLHYGPSFSFRIDSAPNAGTHIIFRLPLKEV